MNGRQLGILCIGGASTNRKFRASISIRFGSSTRRSAIALSGFWPNLRELQLRANFRETVEEFTYPIIDTDPGNYRIE